MRIALLSNVTVELLADLFKPEDAVWCPPGFGAWRQVCLDPPPDLKAFAPDLVVLLLEGRADLRVGRDSGRADLCVGRNGRDGARPSQDGRNGRDGARPSQDDCGRDGARPSQDGCDADVLCDKLRAALPGTSVIRVDLASLADEIGPRFFDSRIETLSGCPWSLIGQRAIRDEIRRLAVLRAAPPKKVLAVDFDGVLWREILSEDGAAAITPAVEFQKGLLALKERGVLLVGLTKNDAADLSPVWMRPQMVLREDDFVAIRANWNPKAENLAEVARELNLGTDAFVFADDNPGECAAMAAAHPGVAVEPVPQPTAAAVRRLARLHFPDFGATDEDRQRTASYRSDVRRREAARGLTIESYLASLETVVDFHAARADEAPRLAQLSLRCNQFNVRQSRYREADVLRVIGDPRRRSFAVSVRDRFGDLGLVAFLVVALGDGAARLEEWVMSCRAMNRRIEDETWERLRAELRKIGVTRIEAEIRPTEKNGPIRGLIGRLMV